ncbi:hypothetical protein PR202_ga13071 [Eleusine coracana subsp. coracana]|uniref:Uncharacterized protein n=1 Tax=Eleusine coracana subsp. coracana TaxID=191504 RepID=A0AAV5CDP3_ELECO|nr:hypothetical protein PR202_ga13071 [Eleusine coracana subsp. coracana]
MVDPLASTRRFIFWSCPQVTSMPPYEQAAFQAISFLQSFYGFAVLDYSYQAMMYYRNLAGSALAFASASVQFIFCVDPSGSLVRALAYALDHTSYDFI